MEREGAIFRLETSRLETSKHESIVQPFLKAAFRQGAHRIRPTHVSQDEWLRQIMIGVVYNDIGSTATVEELGEKHGYSKQWIAASNKSFLRNLWNNSFLELQNRYPLNEVLSARKPLSQRSREKQSASKGGVSLAVKTQVEAGVTDMYEISENTGIPVSKISHARKNRVLENLGIDVSIKLPQHREVLQQLKEEIDDKKTQELLDRLPLHVILYDIEKKKEASQFLSVANLIRECGFHPHNRDIHFFVDSFRQSGIPISRKERVLEGTRGRNLTYFILLSKDKEKAARVLREDQLLQRFLNNPVALFCGPEDTQLPSSTKLAKKEDYEAVGKIFEKFGMHVRKVSNTQYLKYSDIFTPDCPVAIFHYSTSHFYPVAQEEELRSFIAKKLS